MKTISITAILIFLLSTCICRGQIITTFAGNGMYGNTGNGGPATAATLASPRCLAADNAGNIYIGDFNNSVRKVNTAGIINIIAGNGTAGYSGDGGAATAASFYSPTGIAVDTSGVVYLADDVNNCIRSIDQAGIIHTFAGICNPFGWGYTGDGGAATTAGLNLPSGVAADNFGNVYIADMYNHAIRKISGGVISTFAGTGIGGYSGDGGPATAARLRKPTAVAVDATGNVYIADSLCYIRKINTSGIISTIAGIGPGGFSGDGGPATAAKFNHVYGLAVDAVGNIFFSDAGNSRVRAVNIPGIISTCAGTGANGYNGDGIAANTALLDGVFGVTVDGNGSLYIADRDNNRIRKVTMPLSIDETKKEQLVAIYPNPAIDRVSVMAGVGGLLQITNLYQQQVISCKLHAGNNEIILPPNLPHGVYLCRFTYNNHVEETKLIIGN